MWVRRGENLRQAEIRWQEQNDPKMRDLAASGLSRREIGRRFGISGTAVIHALRRQAKRDAAQVSGISAMGAARDE